MRCIYARLSVRPAAQTPTELESMHDARFTMHDGKFIINGHFVIIREGEMRDIFGNIIK